jgi:chromosome segregation ATPase
LTTVLTEEIARIKQESETCLSNIKELYNQLFDLTEELNKLNSTYKGIQTAIHQGAKKANDAQVELKNLAEGIKNQILSAKQQQTDIENEITSTIKKLNDTRDSLQQTLKSIW